MKISGYISDVDCYPAMPDLDEPTDYGKLWSLESTEKVVYYLSCHVTNVCDKYTMTTLAMNLSNVIASSITCQAKLQRMWQIYDDFTCQRVLWTCQRIEILWLTDFNQNLQIYQDFPLFATHFVI